MSLLNSKFDIITHDPHPNAAAGLLALFDVKDAPAPGASGTPTAGSIPAGSIIAVGTDAKAVLADNDETETDAPALLYVTVDGNMDNDGAYCHRLTCIQGGCEILTEQFESDTYAVGDKLTCGAAANAGKFRKVASGEQIYGVVGIKGYNATDGTLHVVIPQGIAPAAS